MNNRIRYATSPWTVVSIGAALLVGLADPSPSQDVGDDQGFYEISFDEIAGTSLVEFATNYQRLTGVVLHFDAHELQRETIWQLGSKRVPRERMHEFFAAVLASKGFEVVQVGPEESGFLSIRKRSRRALPAPSKPAAIPVEKPGPVAQRIEIVLPEGLAERAVRVDVSVHLSNDSAAPSGVTKEGSR